MRLALLRRLVTMEEVFEISVVDEQDDTEEDPDFRDIIEPMCITEDHHPVRGAVDSFDKMLLSREEGQGDLAAAGASLSKIDDLHDQETIDKCKHCGCSPKKAKTAASSSSSTLSENHPTHSKPRNNASSSTSTIATKLLTPPRRRRSPEIRRIFPPAEETSSSEATTEDSEEPQEAHTVFSMSTAADDTPEQEEDIEDEEEINVIDTEPDLGQETAVASQVADSSSSNSPASYYPADQRTPHEVEFGRTVSPQNSSSKEERDPQFQTIPVVVSTSIPELASPRPLSVVNETVIASNPNDLTSIPEPSRPHAPSAVLPGSSGTPRSLPKWQIKEPIRKRKSSSPLSSGPSSVAVGAAPPKMRTLGGARYDGTLDPRCTKKTRITLLKPDGGKMDVSGKGYLF